MNACVFDKIVSTEISGDKPTSLTIDRRVLRRSSRTHPRTKPQYTCANTRYMLHVHKMSHRSDGRGLMLVRLRKHRRKKLKDSKRRHRCWTDRGDGGVAEETNRDRWVEPWNISCCDIVSLQAAISIVRKMQFSDE